MRAVLLAGGVGSRIKEITVPKCTLKINDKAIICHTIEMLLEHNIEVAVVTGYKDEYVKKTLEEAFGNRVQTFHNPFFRVTNSIASLWFARDFAFRQTGDLILANADVLWDAYILQQLLDSPHSRTMVSDSFRVKEGVGDFFFKTLDNFVIDYGKDLALSDRDTEYIGVARIQADSLDGFHFQLEALIHQEKYNMWWENILYENLEKDRIFSLDIQGHEWGEVDSIEDYQRLQMIMRDKGF